MLQCDLELNYSKKIYGVHNFYLYARFCIIEGFSQFIKSEVNVINLYLQEVKRLKAPVENVMEIELIKGNKGRSMTSDC